MEIMLNVRLSCTNVVFVDTPKLVFCVSLNGGMALKSLGAIMIVMGEFEHNWGFSNLERTFAYPIL